MVLCVTTGNAAGQGWAREVQGEVLFTWTGLSHCHPNTGRLGQEDLCEFEATLGYTVNLRPA